MFRASDVERMYAGEDVESYTVFAREDGVEYSVDHAVVDGRDWFYVLHNQNAEDFELVRLPVDDPEAGARDRDPASPGRATRRRRLPARLRDRGVPLGRNRPHRDPRLPRA